MKNIQSIVFFGTHELAVPSLETLAELELLPRLIVTRPQSGLASADGDPLPHPVLPWAKEREIEVVRSRRAMEPDLHEKITALSPDLLVTVDYGRPLPPELLDFASRGAIEVHPSLLPKLRGEHAVRAAISAGEVKTGVSAFVNNEEPWGGPLLFQEELAIEELQTFGKVLPRVEELTKTLLVKALKKADSGKGKVKGKAQNEQNATTPPQIGGRHRRAPWARKASRVFDRLRAYSPPGMLTYFKYRPVEILSGKPMEWVEAPYGSTGTYLGMRQGKLAILCGDATVFGIERLKRPDGEVQGASTFARAEELRVGNTFI